MLYKKRVSIGLAVAVAVGSLVAPWAGGRAADPAGPGDKTCRCDWSKLNYQGVDRCAQCHTQPIETLIKQGAQELVLLTETAIWRTYDKHAQAYAVLKGERGQGIARLLGLKAEDVLDPKGGAGCMSCHAMNNLRKENRARNATGLSPEDGVSCGGCHGPSEKWRNDHADKPWRSKTAREKCELGMRDLRDPECRAEVCVSCHVGNAQEGKVVTHAMFAAGHPPLPSFEIVNFSRNEPQHWRNPVDVPYFEKATPEIINNYHLKDKKFFQTQFSLIGAVVAFRENMRLAHDRANPDPASPATAWPELVLAGEGFRDVKSDELKGEFANRWPEIAMAHSDCFACHHDLKYPGYRQERGFGYFIPGQGLIRVTPGRPVIRSWPLAPLAAACSFSGKKERVAELHGLLEKLAAATNERPFGKPDDIRSATGALIEWSDKVIAELRTAEYSIESARRLILDLTSGFQPAGESSGYVPDYETARLTASMIRAAYGDLARNQGARWAALAAADSREVFDKLSDHLNLEPYTGRKARLGVILGMIAKQLNDREDERFQKGVKSFEEYLQDIRNENALKNLIDNDFLSQLNTRYSSDKFVTGILTFKVPSRDGTNQINVIDRLQEIDDAEEKGTLKAVGEYDPAFILPLLKQFSEIVVRPKD
jgi:hypothetical protein